MNNKKIMIPVAVLCFVIILAIAYAAFTSNLNITGTGNVRDSKWKVYFSRLSEATTTGTATATLPQLQSNATSIGDYTATVMSPGDSISFEVDVTNDGDYDALLSNVTINGTPTCKFGSDTTDTSAQDVCSNLTYSIKYKGGASLIANTDILASKETQTMVVELKYDNIKESNLLPTHDIDITGLGITLTYVQSGNAKVNDDGTTPWVDQYDYHVGDRIQVAGDTTGDYYYVIADSGTNQDYVVALKENPLKATEITAAGGTLHWTYSDANVTGGMSYGSDSTYATSDVKTVVESWATSKFSNSELKIIEGYTVRLISYNDLFDNLGYENQITCTDGCFYSGSLANVPSWVYNSQYAYWTMSPNNDSSSLVWCVNTSGSLNYSQSILSGGPGGAVRPVINLYKSKIAG